MAYVIKGLAILFKAEHSLRVSCHGCDEFVCDEVVYFKLHALIGPMMNMKQCLIANI